MDSIGLFWGQLQAPRKDCNVIMDKKKSVPNVDLALLKRTALFGSIFSPSTGLAGNAIKLIFVKLAAIRFTLQP